MELQSIFLSFSASCPFWKMVPRDLNIHIYHISTVYVKLYQIRISFITLIPDVFIACGIGMPKWRKKKSCSLTLNWNGPSASPTAVIIYHYTASNVYKQISATQSPVTWGLTYTRDKKTNSNLCIVPLLFLFVSSQCLCAGADDVHEGGLYLIAQLYIRVGSTQLLCRPLA